MAPTARLAVTALAVATLATAAGCRRGAREEAAPAPEAPAREEPGLANTQGAVEARPAAAEELPAAPPLRVEGWAVGKAPSAGNRPRFIALWTTWCPGCKGETALLSALARKYADKVDLFAITDERASAVTAFSAKLRAPVTLAFPVATDAHVGERGPTATWSALLEATHAPGVVPYGFLLHRGRVIWHGPPSDAAAALDEVVASGDAAGARAAKHAIAAAGRAYRTSRTAADGRRFLELARGHGEALNSVAWDFADAKSDPNPALTVELARAAVEASMATDFAYLDTLGLALWNTGARTEALEVQRKSIALCDAIDASCGEERGRLAKFEDAVKPAR